MSNTRSANAIVYEDSPLLDTASVQARSEAWTNSQPVISSGLIAVGKITIGAAETALLEDLTPNQYYIANESLSSIDIQERFRDTPRLGALFAAFISIVQWDLGRSSIVDDPIVCLEAPDLTLQLDWHVDPTRKPFVRHLMAVGEESSTRGAIGEFDPADFVHRPGYLNSGVAVQTQEPPFEQGTVLRSIPADVHASPAIKRKRIFMRSHVYIPMGAQY